MSDHLERPVVVPVSAGHSESDDNLPGPPPVAWGVLAATPAGDHNRVLSAIADSPKATLAAQGSGLDREVLTNPQVEAVYVALPAGLQAESVTAAAQARKHVLCQMPLGRNYEEAAAITAACEEAGVLLMEAYMTPFHPRSMVLADTLRFGRLGQLRFARTVYSGAQSPEDQSALRQLGLFCLAPLLFAAGRQPVEVAASAVMANSGVDVAFSGWLDFGEGFSAGFACSSDAPPRQSVEVVGTDAAVLVDHAFRPDPGDTHVDFLHRDGRFERLEPGGGDPYRGMIDHMAAVLRDSADLRWPPARSVEVLALMDRLREAGGMT